MSNKFTRFLNTLPAGPKGNVGDFRHAARIFVDNIYRLAPRHKFLYYIYFEIENSAHQSQSFAALKGDKEMSFLVKRADLPKFTFDSVVKNQYNRKKIIYKQMNFEPINITFHDDNSGLMHALYSLYYGYYVRDQLNQPFDYPNGNRYADTAQRYNMDIDVKINLFKRISLFTLSRQRFNEYRLLAPRITSWQHGDVDYSSNAEPIESSMTIQYEAVNYFTGSVGQGTPDGFASLSYDSIPSPLTLGGGGLRGIAGALGGDILGGITSVFGDISLKNIKERPFTFVGAAVQSINNYQKFNPGSGVGIPGILGAVTRSDVANVVGGVVGAKFPKDPGLGALATTATSKILNQTGGGNSFPSTFKGQGGKPPTADLGENF